MTACNPDFRIHQNSAVQPDIIGAFLDKFFDPCFFDIIFKFNAERAIIPCIGKAAVDFAAAVNKAAVFA